MRMLLTAIASLGLVACATLQDTSKRTIELPTEKYRQPELTAKEAIRKVKESCDKYGRFHVDGVRYTCEQG